MTTPLNQSSLKRFNSPGKSVLYPHARKHARTYARTLHIHIQTTHRLHTHYTLDHNGNKCLHFLCHSYIVMSICVTLYLCTCYVGCILIWINQIKIHTHTHKHYTQTTQHTHTHTQRILDTLHIQHIHIHIHHKHTHRSDPITTITRVNLQSHHNTFSQWSK